jgi:hypothetical protein
MKLKEILLKVLEGKCKRLPDENDEDFLQRCGNFDFGKQASLQYQQRVGTFDKPNINH